MLEQLSQRLIGYRVKAAREAAGWTQDRLAEVMGLKDRQSILGIRKDDTRLLVLNASASPTGKVKKALQYNIPVQSKKEFEDSFYISIN